MEFQYQAKSNSGQATSGVIEAGSLDDARRALRDQGLFVLDIAHAKAGQLAKSISKAAAYGKIKKSDLLVFTTQLTIMCQSGIDLAEALQSTATHCKNPVLKKAVEDVFVDVSDGQTVSSAMSKHTHVFGHAYIASIAAGEASGTLVAILQRLAELLKNEIRLRNTIRSVLSYPLVLLSVATLVVFALIFFVLPQFAIVFRDLGKTPPVMTQMILGLGTAIRSNSLYLGIGGAVAIVFGYRFTKSVYARKLFDGLVLNGPMIQKATRPLFTGRTFRLLGTMLLSGIPLLEAVRLCRSSVKNLLFRNMFDALEQDILNGRGVGEALAQFEFIPPGASQLVTTAEQTGNLGDVSHSIGEFYEESGEENIRQLSKLLEPAIIVVMGGLVAVVMLSIMLPLLDVSTISS